MPALDRLTAPDLYRQLDWLRDEWHQDEEKVARKILRLEQTFAHLPTRYYTQSLALLAVVKRARIVNGVDWRGAISELRRLANEWDKQRPPILACEVCGATMRGHATLANHFHIFHYDHPRAEAANG
jgi:hypothetical protein